MNKFHVAAVALAGFWFGLSGGSSAAENSIKQIQVRRDGDQVLLKVQMSAPLKTLPGNWSVVEPPRVVIDFPETDNQSGQSSQQVAVGDLRSMNLVQTDKLTRLVLNLYRPTKFSTEIVGDVLFVKLQSQSVQASQEPAPSVYQPAAPTATAGKPAPVADTAAVRDIVFRRGEEGQEPTGGARAVRRGDAEVDAPEARPIPLDRNAAPGAGTGLGAKALQGVALGVLERQVDRRELDMDDGMQQPGAAFRAFRAALRHLPRRHQFRAKRPAADQVDRCFVLPVQRARLPVAGDRCGQREFLVDFWRCQCRGQGDEQRCVHGAGLV